MTRRWVQVLCVGICTLGAGVLVLPGCFGASCSPQQVFGNNVQCGGGEAGYMWTGSACIYTRSCNCTGPDCQRLYATQQSCETAHIHCTGR
jgi:hypothetical protein